SSCKRTETKLFVSVFQRNAEGPVGKYLHLSLSGNQTSGQVRFVFGRSGSYSGHGRRRLGRITSLPDSTRSERRVDYSSAFDDGVTIGFFCGGCGYRWMVPRTWGWGRGTAG